MDEDIDKVAELLVNGIEKDEAALKAAERRDPSAALKRSLDYELLAELRPRIWRAVRKKDRFEFLARDATDLLQTPEGDMTALAKLLHPKGADIMETLMRILNHENLVNLVDWIQVQTSPVPRLSSLGTKHYLLWDFCNAGTLSLLLTCPNIIDETRLHKDQLNRIPKDKDILYERWFNKRASSGFLPEAFCWHVLCSVLKALAWLHHGFREVYNPEDEIYEVVQADLDWHTILHRNIFPSSVFFCHPQTKFESYGLCKLGPLKLAVVSGAFNGLIHTVPPVEAKVVAPGEKDMEFRSLEQLLQEQERREEDEEFPLSQGAIPTPYTILDEYAAVGDLIACMMFKPGWSEGDFHFNMLRITRVMDTTKWRVFFDVCPYTGALKNFLHKLIYKKDTEHLSTWHLYQEAAREYANFRGLTDEGKAIVMPEYVQELHQAQLRGEEDAEEAMALHAERVILSQDEDPRFVDPEEPDEVDQLLRQVREQCSRTNEARYDTSAPA